jgi:hypothetical protein
MASADPNENRPAAPSRRCRLFSSISASRYHKKECAALVLEKQIFGVSARDLPTQRTGLLDRE